MSLGARIYAELRGDRTIWMIFVILAIFSLLIVYSSTSAMAHARRAGDTESYLMGQLTFLGVGMFVTYVTYLIHYEKYKLIAPWLMLITIPLLVYTITAGVEFNDARRWIALPYIGRTFQTSDLAKLALVLYVAREITRHKDYIKDFNKAFLPIIVPILIVCGLIAPADLSTSLILLGTCLMMMFVGRVSMKYIVLLVFLWVVLFTFLVTLAQLEIFPELVRLQTWINRMKEFGEGSNIFQVEQAKIAIANGEIFGMGPGNSIQRNFLPAGYADYVYAIIIEEYGLVGGFVTLGLYVLLFFRVTAMVSKDPAKAFGMMVAIGLSLNLVVQALANMAVAVDLVPVTGLTLPMLSMGGTSLIFTCAFFGIILSVSKYVEKAAILGRTATPEIQQKEPATALLKKDGGGNRGGESNRNSGGNSKSGGGRK
ncbi:MAG: cell division protein FtsW [Paraglaciecola sp.]|jgi:cell division protein FtsW